MEKKIYTVVMGVFLVGSLFSTHIYAETELSLTEQGGQESNDLYVIDTIKAVVMNDEGTEIITLSDMNRPSLSGAERKLEDMVFERLVYLDAKKHKISPDDEAIDKYLATVQKEHDLTREQLEEVFAQSGYTFEEGRQEFKKMQANNIILEYKIKSNLVVPRRKIEEYYTNNPEYEEGSYLLERALVLFDPNKTPDEQYKEIINKSIPLSWSVPFKVIKSELAEEKAYIDALAIQEVSKPVALEEGFELYRLLDKQEKRLKTLEECYAQIATILRRPRYMKLVDEYKAELLATSYVQYFL